MDFETIIWTVLAGILGAASLVGVGWGIVDIIRFRSCRRDASLYFLLAMLAGNAALCIRAILAAVT